MPLSEDKPIAIEKLDTTTSKVSNRYGNKKANFKMSMFAYNKMISAIKSRAEKMGIAVFEVNPAYTSQIGKMKYMKRFGISIHEAASFVIARRAMGFKEKLPPVLSVTVTREDSWYSSLGAVEVCYENAERDTYTFVLPFRAF